MGSDNIAVQRESTSIHTESAACTRYSLQSWIIASEQCLRLLPMKTHYGLTSITTDTATTGMAGTKGKILTAANSDTTLSKLTICTM